MLPGIPVVAIGEMGTIDVMGGDNGGFMVKNNQEEFANRVIQLLSDPELYMQKAAEARRHAESWTIDTKAAELESIYAETIMNYVKPGKRLKKYREELKRYTPV
jgi:hypothetical protein